MYVYYLPTHGFNDIISRLLWLVPLCKLTGRTLLRDGERGTYNLDFSKFFTLPGVINDTATIDSILGRYPMVMLPYVAPPHKKKLHKTPEVVAPTLGSTPLVSFVSVRYFVCSYPMFRHLRFNHSVTEECQRRASFLPKPYIGIHVRNTDRKSNFENLYNVNKALIHSYPAVYLATDCKEVIAFFKARTNVKNFTTFPSDGKPMHLSGLSTTDKFMDMVCDLYLIAMADKMLTNSKGGFTKLMGECNRHKHAVALQFESKNNM
jgi:hypothetical protein